MFFENLAFILTSFQQLLLKRTLVFSHKMAFIENEATLLCVTIRECARTSTCSYNLVYNILIYLLPLGSSVFAVHFLNAFSHGNKAFSKGSSWNEVARLLVIFHLPYSKCRGVKICFFSCHYQNQYFSLVSHSCRSCSNHVALVPFVQDSCCLCLIRVALLLLVLHLCRIHVALVWRSCCKLDQITCSHLKLQVVSKLITNCTSNAFIKAVLFFLHNGFTKVKIVVFRGKACQKTSLYTENRILKTFLLYLTNYSKTHVHKETCLLSRNGEICITIGINIHLVIPNATRTFSITSLSLLHKISGEEEM